jgi:hypothetical protein
MVLLNTSLVIVVLEKPNPSLFTRDYLESKGIFSDFEVANATTLGPINQFVFKNGYVFEAIHDRLDVIGNKEIALSA